MPTRIALLSLLLAGCIVAPERPNEPLSVCTYRMGIAQKTAERLSACAEEYYQRRGLPYTFTHRSWPGDEVYETPEPGCDFSVLLAFMPFSGWDWHRNFWIAGGRAGDMSFVNVNPGTAVEGALRCPIDLIKGPACICGSAKLVVHEVDHLWNEHLGE